MVMDYCDKPKYNDVRGFRTVKCTIRIEGSCGGITVYMCVCVRVRVVAKQQISTECAVNYFNEISFKILTLFASVQNYHFAKIAAEFCIV
jgi:hypothetical protein